MFELASSLLAIFLIGLSTFGVGRVVLRRFAIDGAWFEPGWVAGAIVLVPFVAFLGQLALRAL